MRGKRCRLGCIPCCRDRMLVLRHPRDKRRSCLAYSGRCNRRCLWLSVGLCGDASALHGYGSQRRTTFRRQACRRAAAALAWLEQPVSIAHQAIGRKCDQTIQPWQFGHGETKATCLWLHNLPKLKPTNIVEGREARVHRMPPSLERAKLRSKTYQGIADAMASQWGEYLKSIERKAA